MVNTDAHHFVSSLEKLVHAVLMHRVTPLGRRYGAASSVLTYSVAGAFLLLKVFLFPCRPYKRLLLFIIACMGIKVS